MKTIAKRSLFFMSIFTGTVNVSSNHQQTQSAWSEFSFVIKPSPLGGVGVFATHDIPAGIVLFNCDFTLRTLFIKDVPQELINYCIYLNDEECLCPERFDRMEIGWYINHSSNSNIAKKEELTDDVAHDLKKRNVYTIKNIKAGEEILIDYNYLKEPEHLKEDFYRVCTEQSTE
jgi:hypothetical protein